MIKKSTMRQVKWHHSPLHVLSGIFRVNPDVIEKIPPVCTHPKKRSLQDICIDIPPGKEESKRADATAREKIKVYSDSSIHDNKVGVAAILKHKGKLDQALKLHLGTTEQHTAYKTELVGMIMGLYLIKTESRNRIKCALSINSQAALSTVKSKMNKSGQHLAVDLLKLEKQLIKCRDNSRFRLMLRWFIGHVGIKGNKDADKAAKAATDRECAEKLDLPPPLPPEDSQSQPLHNQTSTQ